MAIKHFSRGAGLLASSLLAATAHADVSCTGLVSFVGVDGAGNVVAQLDSRYVGQGTQVHRICNLTPPNGLSPPGFPSMNYESCRAAHATLVAAKMSNNAAQIYYHGISSCGAIGYWANTDAYFVGSQ